MRQEQFLQLPIRRILFTTHAHEREALLTQAIALYNRNDISALLELVDWCLPRDEQGNFITANEKSDVVHDILAHLAEQMTKMNKDENKEIKGFLNWLESEMGVKIDDINLKTRIREYYKFNFYEFLAALAKNRKKFKEGYDPTKRENRERLLDEYNTSVAKLKPLIENIKATDRLIDRIVYKLYGLADDEIKIVETTKKNKNETVIED